MKLVKYTNLETMISQLAQVLARELTGHLETHSNATFVVPGGTTPGPIFDVLCSLDLGWDRVSVMLSDERWLPETHARSNTRLLRERLLVNHAARANYVPLYQSAREPEPVLESLQTNVATHLPISVLLLGMGADMHTASLFPGADRLEEGLAADAPCLLPMRAPGAPEARVTLTAPVLSSAINTHAVIIGNDKLDALEQAQSLPPSQAPISVILNSATVHWTEK